MESCGSQLEVSLATCKAQPEEKQNCYSWKLKAESSSHPDENMPSFFPSVKLFRLLWLPPKLFLSLTFTRINMLWFIVHLVHKWKREKAAEIIPIRGNSDQPETGQRTLTLHIPKPSDRSAQRRGLGVESEEPVTSLDALIRNLKQT